MNHRIVLASLLLPLCAAAPALAQIQIPINPKATFLRTNIDAQAVPAAAVPLAALSVAPGQWLSISTTGGFSNNGSADNQRNLACVFSSSNVLSPDGVQNRVPGAIAAGTAYTSALTLNGNLPTDIPQDFAVTNTKSNGTLVKVPPGATHIFYAIADNSYSGNTDPNNDYFVVFAAGIPGSMQGTAEDCELLTGVSALPTLTPDVKTAVPFTTIYAEIRQRYDLTTNQVYLLAWDAFPTAGAPPLELLPGIHMGPNFAVAQFGLITTTPAQWSVFTAPGFAGDTIVLQAAFLTAQARNGWVETSNAHQIQLQ
ncbi:MAG: hypothetical protein JNL08_08110 [Planctomycetes bacterium]|nr:hypothetical protein [Planctomycetota bacterium]